MNFKAIPNANDTNVRNVGSTMGYVIRKVGVNDILEGNYLVKDAQNRDWLAVLLINGVQTTTATFIATWVCNVEYTPSLPPIDPLQFQVGLRIVADSPLKLSRVNIDGTKTEVFAADAGEYAMEFVANDSNAPFIRME